jgi:hypothetical protein
LPIGVLCTVAVASWPLATSAVLTSAWLAITATAVRRVGLAALAFPAVLICHHMAYGANFLRGLLTRRGISF